MLWGYHDSRDSKAEGSFNLWHACWTKSLAHVTVIVTCNAGTRVGTRYRLVHYRNTHDTRSSERPPQVAGSGLKVFHISIIIFISMMLPHNGMAHAWHGVLMSGLSKARLLSNDTQYAGVSFDGSRDVGK